MSRGFTESANYPQDCRGKAIYQQTPDEKRDAYVHYYDRHKPACALGDASSQKRQKGEEA